MAWETPKTDWTADDTVEYSDYNRIKGNLEYLNGYASELYKDFDITGMGDDLTVESCYYPSQFNKFETNLETINNNVFTRDYGDSETFYANAAFIDYIELNRIESAMLGIYEMLNIQKAHVRRLSYTLGLEGGIV